MRAILFLLVLTQLPMAAYARSDSAFVEDLTWPEVQEAITHGKTTAIYYAGSTEQNGPHMILGKHNVIARYVAGRIAAELGNALVYPVLPFAPTGDPRAKTGHMRFPGSVSLSNATYGAVAHEVALSAFAAGFKNVVLMGDHGDGQDTLRQVAAKLGRAWAARGLHVYYIGDLYYKSREQVRDYLLTRGLAPGGHAGIADTSELMFLDGEQRRVRKDRLAPGGGKTGVDGDPRSASAELGKLFLDIKVRNAVAQIKSLIDRGG